NIPSCPIHNSVRRPTRLCLRSSSYMVVGPTFAGQGKKSLIPNGFRLGYARRGATQFYSSSVSMQAFCYTHKTLNLSGVQNMAKKSKIDLKKVADGIRLVLEGIGE